MKAIVTGHTRGLGAAITEALLKRGIAVLGLARAANDVAARGYPNLLQQISLDLADDAALTAWLATDALPRYIADAGTLLLVNNAGTLGPVGPLAVQDSHAIATAVALNVTAPLLLSSALARQHRGPLRIVHVSSGAARDAYPGWSLYGATKAALDHHARATQLDGRSNLRLCSLAPGVIDTDMQAEIRAIEGDRFPLKEKFESLKREGRLSSPHQAAELLVNYLLSEQFGEQAVADLRNLPPPR